MAQECGIDHFSVFSADEAYRLLQVASPGTTIMIMGFLDEEQLEWAIANGIEFYVFHIDRLERAVEVARKLQKPARIHLDLETGMNRIGLGGAELKAVVRMLQQNKALVEIAGICTHFAGAESSENHERVTSQLEKYSATVNYLSSSDIAADALHTACSAAVVAYPETHLNMVRVGIMQYGFWSSPEIFQRYMQQNGEQADPLKRLINWKSHIMTIKLVAVGEFIGYGNSYQAKEDMLLATVPVGYAWGYSRSLSNQGEVLIRGHRVPVVGIVNMNVLMVDVTSVPDVALNDEVVLLGHQGEENITVASFAELSTQLNYELLTRLPMNIPRYIID